MAKNRKMASACSVADEHWRVESDLRTLCEADEIRKDPKRLEKATALAKEKTLEMAAVAAEGAKD